MNVEKMTQEEKETMWMKLELLKISLEIASDEQILAAIPAASKLSEIVNQR